MNNKQKEDTATLEILQTIENHNDVTQRHLADRLDIALGLANLYLKKCVQKGLVKIHQAPANRYLYYLTPKGFSEKSRLTAEYLSTSFNYYRDVSESLIEIYEHCEEKNWKQVIFCGVSELAEIASIRAQEHNITIVGIWDPQSTNNKSLNLPVWHSLTDIVVADVYLLTSLNNSEQLIKELLVTIEKEKILIPSILGISQFSSN